MMIRPTHYQVHMTPMTFSRSWGQRSRSGSDRHGNFLNAIAHEPLKGYEPKITEILPTTQAAKCLGFQGRVCKGQGHGHVFRRRHTDLRFTVEDHLALWIRIFPKDTERRGVPLRRLSTVHQWLLLYAHQVQGRNFANSINSGRRESTPESHDVQR